MTSNTFKISSDGDHGMLVQILHQSKCLQMAHPIEALHNICTSSPSKISSERVEQDPPSFEDGGRLYPPEML